MSEKLSIPVPQPILRGKGINSTGLCGSNAVRTRMTKKERQTVAKAADKLGITSSNFMRWVAVYAAEEVLK